MPISERKILEGGLVVAVVILAGQALGFIRQATIAYLLGTGAQADALAVGIAPVDLWWSVVATTVIFGFGPLLAAGDRRLTVGVLARPVLAVSISATTLLLLFAETAVRIFGPGLAPATAATAAALLRCAGLAIPAVSASTLFTALLYSERRFAFAAFHQGTVSIATIAAAVTLHKWLGPFGFAAGYAGGAWLQLALAWAISRPILRQRGAVACPSTRTVPWSAPLSVLCYSAFIGMNPAVTRALASTFGAGAAVGFDYSLKLIGVPLALLVSPVSSSLLSEIAPFRLRRDGRIAMGTVGKAAMVTFLLSTLVVAFLLTFGPRLIALLFERGRFTDASTLTVRSILTGFCPVLIAWSVLDVVSRSLFSLGRPRIPILCAAMALAINVALSRFGAIGSLSSVGVPTVIGFLAGSAVAVAYVVRLSHREGETA